MLKENKDSKLKNRLKLYFDKPANISEDQLANWYRALSVANGRIGAMVYGGIKREHIQLNEELIWAGPLFPHHVVTKPWETCIWISMIRMEKLTITKGY